MLIRTPETKEYESTSTLVLMGCKQLFLPTLFMIINLYLKGGSEFCYILIAVLFVSEERINAFYKAVGYFFLIRFFS